MSFRGGRGGMGQRGGGMMVQNNRGSFRGSPGGGARGGRTPSAPNQQSPMNQRQNMQRNNFNNSNNNLNQSPNNNNNRGRGGGNQSPSIQRNQNNQQKPQNTPNQNRNVNDQQNNGKPNNVQDNKPNQQGPNQGGGNAGKVGGLPQRDANKGKTPSVTKVEIPDEEAKPRDNKTQQQQAKQQNQSNQQQQRNNQRNDNMNNNQRMDQQQGRRDDQNMGGGGGGNRNMGGQGGARNMMNQQRMSNQGMPQGQNKGPQNADENSENTKLFIATIKQGTTDNEFKELFEKFGKVTSCYLNKHKWFGVVSFETHEQADAARKHYERTNIMKLKWAQMSPKETPLILNEAAAQEAKMKKESSSKCRLFVGNLPPDISEANFRSLFERHGVIAELYLPPGKFFALVRFETKSQADAAKIAMDGQTISNRQIQVRYASQGTCLKVRNLSPFVTNELLQQAFEPFGELERATVYVDERGKSLCEGVLEFAKKPVAMAVMRKAQQECLLLTTSPLPVIIEPLEIRDDEEGFPEKQLNKASPAFISERDKGPRFAEKGSFEHSFAMQWKELLLLEKRKREHFEREMEEERAKLHEEMDILRFEFELASTQRKLAELQKQADQMEAKKAEVKQMQMEREKEKRAIYKEIMRKQAEILGYPFEDDCNDNVDMNQGAVNEGASMNAVPPPVALQAAVPSKPSAAAQDFMKQWNTLTRGEAPVTLNNDIAPQQVPPPVMQEPQQQGNGGPQEKRWAPPGAPVPGVPGGKSNNTNKPAYMSYLGQSGPQQQGPNINANGKRLSDPGPAGKRRRF